MASSGHDQLSNRTCNNHELERFSTVAQPDTLPYSGDTYYQGQSVQYAIPYQSQYSGQVEYPKMMYMSSDTLQQQPQNEYIHSTERPMSQAVDGGYRGYSNTAQYSTVNDYMGGTQYEFKNLPENNEHEMPCHTNPINIPQSAVTCSSAKRDDPSSDSRTVITKSSATSRQKNISPFMMYYCDKSAPAQFAEKAKQLIAQQTVTTKPQMLIRKTKRQSAACGGGAHDYHIVGDVYREQKENDSKPNGPKLLNYHPQSSWNSNENHQVFNAHINTMIQADSDMPNFVQRMQNSTNLSDMPSGIQTDEVEPMQYIMTTQPSEYSSSQQKLPTTTLAPIVIPRGGGATYTTQYLSARSNKDSYSGATDFSKEQECYEMTQEGMSHPVTSTTCAHHAFKRRKDLTALNKKRNTVTKSNHAQIVNNSIQTTCMTKSPNKLCITKSPNKLCITKNVYSTLPSTKQRFLTRYICKPQTNQDSTVQSTCCDFLRPIYTDKLVKTPDNAYIILHYYPYKAQGSIRPFVTVLPPQKCHVRKTSHFGMADMPCKHEEINMLSQGLRTPVRSC